jgi:hypothetical protein
MWLIYSLNKNEYRILKPAETTIRKGIKENEEKQEMNQLGLQYIIHENITITFISNKQKCHFFLFSSKKPENRKAEQVLPEVKGECWYQ